MTKHLYSTGLLIGSFLLASSSAIAAGSLVTGKSIVFEEADFSGELTAQKNWVINNPSTDLDTEVYAVTRATHAGSPNGRRLAFTQAAQDLLNSLTWSIVVPEEYEVTSFTFAASALWFTGSGDDSVQFQYSFDNTNWTVFYDHANNHESPGLKLVNQTFTVDEISGSSHTLYVRILGVEGTVTTGDSNYFALASKDSADGGIDSNSYFAVTVAQIPEAANFSLILPGLTLLALSSRRFQNKRR